MSEFMPTLEYDATCAYSAPAGKILTRGYGKKLKDCGRTTCCYLAQRMFLIEQAIYYLGYDIKNDIVKRLVDLVFMSLNHSAFDPIFNSSIGVPQQNQRIIEIINNFFGKAQTENEYTSNHAEKYKLTERLRYLTQIGSSNLTNKLTPLIDYGIDNLFINGGGISGLGKPISLVLRNSATNPEGSFYDVDHWCVFHNGQFRGTWGADDGQFRWNTHDVPKEALIAFVTCINEAKDNPDSKKEKYVIFKSFLKTYMTPPEDLISQSVDPEKSVDNFIDKNYERNFHNYAIEIIHGWQYHDADATKSIIDEELFDTIREVIRTLNDFGMIVQKKRTTNGENKNENQRGRSRIVPENALPPVRDRSRNREDPNKGGANKTRKKRKRRTRKSIKRKRNISLKKRR